MSLKVDSQLRRNALLSTPFGFKGLYTQVCLKVIQEPSGVQADDLDLVIEKSNGGVALGALTTATSCFSCDRRLDVENDHEHNVCEV